jgi:hypothetical protein
LIYAIYVAVNNAYAKYLISMPRPEIYPVKKLIGFNQAQLDAIDEWRRRQTPIPSVSEAIRRLVEQALNVKSSRDEKKRQR